MRPPSPGVCRPPSPRVEAGCLPRWQPRSTPFSAAATPQWTAIVPSHQPFVEIPSPIYASTIAAHAASYAAMLPTTSGSSTNSSSGPLGALGQDPCWYIGGHAWVKMGEEARDIGSKGEVSQPISRDRRRWWSCRRGVGFGAAAGCLQGCRGLTPGRRRRRVCGADPSTSSGWCIGA
jgi:hypothetical protein